MPVDVVVQADKHRRQQRHKARHRRALSRLTANGSLRFQVCGMENDDPVDGTDFWILLYFVLVDYLHGH